VEIVSLRVTGLVRVLVGSGARGGAGTGARSARRMPEAAPGARTPFRPAEAGRLDGVKKILTTSQPARVLTVSVILDSGAPSLLCDRVPAFDGLVMTPLGRGPDTEPIRSVAIVDVGRQCWLTVSPGQAGVSLCG
jgi:hypothetical protein